VAVDVSQQQSLLGRPFDQYQNLMQIARCIEVAGEQLGDPHPRILELSRRDTGLADYVPNAEIVRLPTHDAGTPAPERWQHLPFADDAFDVCLVTDVYEHIAAEHRPHLLQEMMRVSRGLILLGCPIENHLVSRFDKVVFDFIWGKYAEPYAPLAQHVNYGIESLAHVIGSMKAAGANDVIALPCNYIYRWIHLILVYFDLQHRNPLPEVCEAVNQVYNTYLSPFDYREPCYRYLIVAVLDPRLSVAQLNARLRAPAEPRAAASHAAGLLIEAFRAVDSRACDELRLMGAELQRVHAAAYAQISARDELVRTLQAELDIRVGERDRLIRELQAELHTQVGERDALIRDLQAQLTARDRALDAAN
jgi:hypothetical protein